MTGGFELHSARAVHFGSGVRNRVGPLVKALGGRVFLVTGGHSLAASGELARLEQRLAEQGLTVIRFAVQGEPDIAVVDEAVRCCCEGRGDVVLGVGGGSVLDAAKATAAMVTNGGAALDYLPDVPGLDRSPRSIVETPLPFVAMPTTAGSGSEVTKNAVLRVPDAGVKRSLRSDLMVPTVALVDPGLCLSAPKEVTVPAALDALTHLLEGYVSLGHQPTTDLIALEGLRRSFAALTQLAASADGAISSAIAEDLALASLWGGMVLANAGLGAVHGLVAPLGGRFPVPHGCGCGALLAATVRANVAALGRRDPDGPALRRYAEIAGILHRRPARAEEAAEPLDDLRRRLGGRTLAGYGVTERSVAGIIPAARGGSMKTNPIALTDAELEQVLRESLAGSTSEPG